MDGRQPWASRGPTANRTRPMSQPVRTRVLTCRFDCGRPPRSASSPQALQGAIDGVLRPVLRVGPQVAVGVPVARGQLVQPHHPDVRRALRGHRDTRPAHAVREVCGTSSSGGGEGPPRRLGVHQRAGVAPVMATRSSRGLSMGVGASRSVRKRPQTTAVRVARLVAGQMRTEATSAGQHERRRSLKREVRRWLRAREAARRRARAAEVRAGAALARLASEGAGLDGAAAIAGRTSS